MKIIGIKPTVYDFVDKSGRQIHSEGVTLFLSNPMTRPGCVGVSAESVYLSSTKLGSYAPAIGDEVEIFYNRFGKVSAIQPVDAY